MDRIVKFKNSAKTGAKQSEVEGCNEDMSCTRHTSRLLITLVWLSNIILLHGTSLITSNPNTIPSPPVSIFGDTITNQRRAQINILFAYSIPTDKVNIGTPVSPGSSGTSNSLAYVSTGAGASGAQAINSKAAIQYIPGHDIEYLFTAMFTTGVANSTQWIGALTADDGFAVGYNGATFSILYRNSASGSLVTTTIAQTSFNIDPLNGTGPSGITLVPTNLNIFKISFGWLGTAPIIFWVMRSDGTWWKFHMIQRPNSYTLPSVSIPMLPMRAEVTNSGNTSDLRIYTGSWMGGTIGFDDATIVRSYAFDRLAVTGVSTTEVPILSIRNIGTSTTPSTYQGKTNYLQIRILFACVSTETTNVLSRFRLLKNASLTGASFSTFSANNSIALTDISASNVSGGTEALAIFGSNDSSTNLPILTNGINIVLLPGDTLTLTAYATASATVNGSIAWQEPVA